MVLRDFELEHLVLVLVHPGWPVVLANLPAG